MKRPSNAVVEGLKSLAALIQAGSCVDVMGYEEELLDVEQQKTWRQICEACDWIVHL